jgi:hypothetical protein
LIARPLRYFAQQLDGSAQQLDGAGAATPLAQQSQLHAAQSQTPVVQQPQQSQVVLHAQLLLAVVDTAATASAPEVTRARTDPIKNLNIASTPKRQ